MNERSTRHPSDSGEASTSRGDRHATKTPQEPDDTTASGDAKSGVGEDNQGAKRGGQSADDFIRR